MSHRENSLTPWITNESVRAKQDEIDAAKHKDCIERTGYPCVILPPNLYEQGEALGMDMRDYVKNKPLPTSDELLSRMGYRQFAVNTRRPIRKHVSERTCHGKESVCLPGLGGKCVACSDDD